MWRTAALLAGLVLLPATAFPQYGENVWTQRYGTPVDVSIDDLTQEAGSYQDRAVRTHGRLENAMGVRGWVLRSPFGNVAAIAPVGDAAGPFESESLKLMGRDVSVTGVIQMRASGTSGEDGSRFTIRFWSFESRDADARPEKVGQSTPLSLEELLKQPGKHDGKMVRVVGKFRGRNLFGDLPGKSMRQASDWVIKDDLYAVWVGGRKSKGAGFDLDASLKRDTGKWLEVIGRPETIGGVTHIRASSVSLSAPPTPTAEAKPAPLPPPKPKVPPSVVFALPLDGDAEVPAGSSFVVQFSKDMDEETFAGRVRVRYVEQRPGDRQFDGLKLSYDGGRRALAVDPGDVIPPGRQVEVMLLPGIADIDGLTLVPRKGEWSGAEAVDVLRYRIER